MRRWGCATTAGLLRAAVVHGANSRTADMPPQ